MNSIKKYVADNLHGMSAESAATYLDFQQIFQLILSKRLQSETANGMTNLMYAIGNPNATTEHIENAVVKLN